jgi:hypothetical protein
MKELLGRFSLEAVKFNGQILACLILIWVAVLACAISSIMAQPFSKRQRAFWIGLILCVPLVGLLAYLPFSFRKEELPHIFLAKRKKEKKRPAKTIEVSSTNN